jgi:hypothetical protein
MPRGRPKKIEAQAKTLESVMTDDQKKTMRELVDSVETVIMSYRDLRHPNYDEVVNIDNNFINFRYTFREVLKND